MKRTRFKQNLVAAALWLLLGIAPSLQAAIVFQDSLTNFALGNLWQAHGAGAPDLALSTFGVGVDGSSLRMGSSAGTGGEVVGVETINSFSIAGVRLLRVTARLRPLNQTSAGDGGASDASAGIAVIGVSGAFSQASAGANRAAQPDWGDFYTDSEHSSDGNSAAFAHFPPNDPAGGAEAFRTFVLEIRTNGTSLTTLSSAGQPLAVTPFNVLNPNLTLAAFGNRITIALFQQRSDSTGAPENTFGDFDSVKVEIEGDVVALLDDTFQPPGSGPGANWEAAASGFPNMVNDRITLDATHLGLRLATLDPSGASYGVQLVTPLVLPTDATSLEIDFLVQPRNGGLFDARLVLQDTGDSDSLAVSFNEFFGGQVRRFATLGSGSGGAFDQRSAADYAFGPYTFYHALVSVSSAGTTVRFRSEDLSTLLQTFVVPQLTLANLLGSSVRLSILLADTDNALDGGTQPECLADRLTVSVNTTAPPPLIISIARGGNAIDDSKPSGSPHDGVNFGATWAASNTDSTPTIRNGVMQFSAATTNQIVLAGDPDFNSASGTIMFWMRSAGTIGSGNEGAMLFDRRPTDTNGAPGAVLVQTDAGKVLFQAASGAGIGGFPNEVSQRINLDATHSGYRMRSSDTSGTVYGIRLATPPAISTLETNLALDLLVQNRLGGEYPARLVLNGFSGTKSLSISLNEFSGGHVRQFVTFGSGGGGAFDLASPDYTQGPYNFYHVLVSIGSAGTTIELMSEDLSTLLHSFSVPELTIADLAGSSVQLSILQAANTSGGSTEALVDNLNVTSATSGVLLDDSFDPPGTGPGANWVAASGNGVANQFQTVGAINDNHWHQIALAYDQSASGSSDLFINGVLDSSQPNAAAWAWGAMRPIELGRSHSSYWRAYDGVLDDLRIYNRKLTAAEIAQAAGTGALVDPAALMVRFNFSGPPSGATLTWPLGGPLESTTDLTPPAIWSPVPGSFSPYFIRPSDAPMRFYRAVGL